MYTVAVQWLIALHRSMRWWGDTRPSATANDPPAMTVIPHYTSPSAALAARSSSLMASSSSSILSTFLAAPELLDGKAALFMNGVNRLLSFCCQQGLSPAIVLLVADVMN